MAAGALSLDAGCSLGGFVPSGSSCRFSRDGYTCEETQCTAGVWSDKSITCTANPCPYNDLTKIPPIHDKAHGMPLYKNHDSALALKDCYPDCASALPAPTTRPCKAGAAVPSGTTCQFAAPAIVDARTPSDGAPGEMGGSPPKSRFLYTCASPTCTEGNWSTTTVDCRPNTCKYDEIHTIEAGAIPSGANCTSGKDVSSHAVCSFSKHGHTCDSTACLFGTWTNKIIKCYPNSCNMSTSDSSVTHTHQCSDAPDTSPDEFGKFMKWGASSCKAPPTPPSYLIDPVYVGPLPHETCRRARPLQTEIRFGANTARSQ